MSFEQSITRFEVIDHRKESVLKEKFGRILTIKDCHVELQVQDDGKTLKVFVT